MRTSPAISILEGSGYSECLDRLSASGGVPRPLATYRLQLSADFRFADAERLLPYLDALGVTHLYVSPILQARAGSTHGYDITDHNQLNPELGSERDLRRLARALKQRGMSLILDLVSNHVGVGNHNKWWQDVLENGQTSEFAGYFDIDWAPLKEEMHHKMLLPVLAAQYGEELEGGKLKLMYLQADGKFAVEYYESRFPIDPQTYPLVFATRPRPVAYSTGQDKVLPAQPELSELRALLSEFNELPPHWDADSESALLRRARLPELIARLSDLVRDSDGVRRYVEASVARCNGSPGRSRSYDCLHRLLEAQAYRLAHWKVSAEEINYRRFFDINDLVGLRMENPRVFAATHQLIRRLLAEQLISGLRIDHPDGLLNPRQYFTRLQMLYCAAHCAGPVAKPPLAPNGMEEEFQEIFGRHQWAIQRPPLYVLVEKILQPGERLPAEWPVDGSVGYEFAALANGLFIDPQGERPLTNLYRRFTGGSGELEETIYSSKRLIMKSSLPSEINVLTHMLAEICRTDRRARDYTQNALRDAVREIIACFPVYRTYIDERGEVSERDRATLLQAVARAKRRNESAPAAVFDFIRDILLLEAPAHGAPADARKQRLAFTLKFQQLTGPVMAKSLEDTAFYVYNRFIALNEVGASPDRFGVSLQGFHQENLERGRDWPASMLATSTHDTKRSEDVRARLDVLSEIPGAWSAQVNRWRRANHVFKRTLGDGRSVPDANEEYFLYQTLVGAAPLALTKGKLDDAELEDFSQRIKAYMTKAVHEAKVNLSWINPNAEYVEALSQFIDRILASPERRRRNNFWKHFTEFLPLVSFFGAMNSLAQTLLKITCPGVPDIYQGNELWDFSLVDPDNRRPIDFQTRERMLAELLTEANRGDLSSVCEELLSHWPDGRIKMWVTHQALAFRREHHDLFMTGSYVPLEVSGSRREHVVAFARAHEERDQMAIVAAPRLSCSLMRGEMRPPLATVWDNTELQLPRPAPTHLLNVFSGEVIESQNGTLLCREIFRSFPLALLAAR